MRLRRRSWNRVSRALDVMERIALRVATEVATQKREAAKAAKVANAE